MGVWSHFVVTFVHPVQEDVEYDDADNLGIILGMDTFNLAIILVMDTFNLGIILGMDTFNITGLILLY